MDKLQIGLEILKILNSHFYEAYLVGGAVRDFILKRPISDIDITTNAKPSAIAQIFEDVHFKGDTYLSCRIVYLGSTFEVTSFRRDISYEDHRHPIVEEASTLQEDLIRRDFTMNALAMNAKGEIIDLFHGREDMENKVIRMIGNPMLRFKEDALRVVRALQFSSRLNFTLDKAIIHSFSQNDVQFLKENYIKEMLDSLMAAPFDLGLSYIKEYQILSSFPFYQVVCEEAYRYHYRKNAYALFEAIHHFLPVNILLSKKERALARDISYFVRKKFDAISLYYGNETCLESAVELYNALYKEKVQLEEIQRKKAELPIHTPKDICIDWSWISSSQRGITTKKLENAILCGQIKNEFKSIKNFLETGE